MEKSYDIYSSYADWLETSIANESLEYFEYSEFSDMQLIGEGSFANILRANWKNSNIIVALKVFNTRKSILKEVVKEVRN